MRIKIFTLAFLFVSFAFAHFTGNTCSAQPVLPTVYSIDTVLAGQLHIDLTPKFDPVTMTDTAYYMTVVFSGGVTPLWLKAEVWLYGKDYKAATRVDRGNMIYTISGPDLANVWTYRIPYLYYKMDCLLSLTPKP